MPQVAEKQQKQQIYDNLMGYREDPVGCFVNMLDVKGEHIWSKMIDVAESVRDNQFTAVPAGHSVSKTYTAGRIAVWFKTCFQPSTVITTAPSDNQVRNQLWREIHTAHAGAKVPLGGKITSLMWDVKPKPSILSTLAPDEKALWEKNFAIGFSTSPDMVTEHATKMQGWHNQWLLVILDEACGILPQIWRTVMEGLIINKRCKVLAIGNLTDPLSEFAQACKEGSGWNVVRISVKDTPNYISNTEIIPGVAGRDYEQFIAKKHGVNSNAYKIRILGETPEFREGTFYGKELAEAEQAGRIGNYPHDATAKVYRFWDLGSQYTSALDVQFLGGVIRLIDCYWDNQGAGMPAHEAAMSSRPYKYAGQYTGRDLITSNRKAGITGMMTKDIAAQLGVDLIPVIESSFDDGIEAVRSIWPLIEVNKSLCHVFLEAVRGYRKKKNEALSTEDQPAYHKDPLPNAWQNHLMDSLRHLAIVYRYMSIEGNYIGATVPVPVGNDDIEPDYDPLEAYRRGYKGKRENIFNR